MNANSRTLTIRAWALAAGILVIGTALSAILAAVILDVLIQRPSGGGSVTTLIPGFVYAAATVMKVCLVAGLASALVALMLRLFGGRLESGSASAARTSRLPGWAIASITLAPLTPLAGAIAVVIVQATAHEMLSLRDFTYVSRSAVFVKLALLSVGVAAAILSLTRTERSRPLAMLGLLVNSLLIGLFWHFEFYAIGFDQDAWAGG